MGGVVEAADALPELGRAPGVLLSELGCGGGRGWRRGLRGWGWGW